MAEIKKARILYSNMWIGFTEDKRNIAGLSKVSAMVYPRLIPWDTTEEIWQR